MATVTSLDKQILLFISCHGLIVQKLDQRLISIPALGIINKSKSSKKNKSCGFVNLTAIKLSWSCL